MRNDFIRIFGEKERKKEVGSSDHIFKECKVSREQAVYQRIQFQNSFQFLNKLEIPSESTNKFYLQFVFQL